MDSPVMAASFTCASPSITRPSAGTFSPEWMKRMSFSWTSSAAMISSLPSLTIRASSGARSSSDFKEDLLFSSVRCSRYDPSMNRNVTAADSEYSPIKSAPITATVTSNSMLITFSVMAWKAFLAIG
jgi:hypothetical protein